MDYQKGPQIATGKTKTLFAVEEFPELAIMKNSRSVTAFDDPNKTKEFGTKDRCATTTTCRVFELLRDADIPVVYRQQLSDTELLVEKSDMVPLEVIVRRYIVPASSYLKRRPDLNQAKLPMRFPRLVVEFFLKTTNGSLKIGEKVIVEGLDASPEGGQEDPFIINPYEAEWRLFHSKKPEWVGEADLQRTVTMIDVVSSVDFMHKIADLAEGAFLVLEKAWAVLGYRLIDFKIEVTRGGKIGDVIDNDSWRLLDPDWNDVSKQAFRDGEGLGQVQSKYERVALLSERLRIPKQALVLWRGSDSDKLPNPPGSLCSINFEDIVCSGHKSTIAALNRLSDLEKQYPEGGVILAIVGRSNGLGPILAAHTTWPVVSVPATMDSFPMDVWSSLRMPSKVPMGTTWPASNAVDFALNILAQNNPQVYAHRRMITESLEE